MSSLLKIWLSSSAVVEGHEGFFSPPQRTDAYMEASSFSDTTGKKYRIFVIQSQTIGFIHSKYIRAHWPLQEHTM